MYVHYTVTTDMFQPLMWPSSGWLYSCSWRTEDSHMLAALNMATFLPPWRLPHSFRPENDNILATLKIATIFPPWRWPHSFRPEDDHILAALKMSTLLPPYRWAHERPKHVGGSYIISSHSYTQVHSWMIFSRCIILSKVSLIWPNTITAIQ